MNILKVTHSAGFFSCYSKRLEAIVSFYNTYKHAPDRVDSSSQFALYKTNPEDDLSGLYFKEIEGDLVHARSVSFHNDYQFVEYKDLDLAGIGAFVAQYFSPSTHVVETVSLFEQKYQFDYSQTCAVFYRGNDKVTETAIAPYESFIAQAKEVSKKYEGVVFLVQTDETEFLEAFMKVFPTTIHIQEIPHMSKKVSTIHDEMPREERAEFGVRFFAATLVLSKCAHIITHTGNCGLWCILYRGNTKNVHQWMNNSWERSRFERYMHWVKIETKSRVRKLLKGTIGWRIVRT